jgi:hypothetical protein
MHVIECTACVSDSAAATRSLASQAIAWSLVQSRMLPVCCVDAMLGGVNLCS